MDAPGKPRRKPEKDIGPAEGERPGGVISSSELFPPGTRDLFIEHEGSLYRLSLTRQNKLILTK